MKHLLRNSRKPYGNDFREGPDAIHYGIHRNNDIYEELIDEDGNVYRQRVWAGSLPSVSDALEEHQRKIAEMPMSDEKIEQQEVLDGLAPMNAARYTTTNPKEMLKCLLYSCQGEDCVSQGYANDFIDIIMLKDGERIILDENEAIGDEQRIHMTLQYCRGCFEKLLGEQEFRGYKSDKPMSNAAWSKYRRKAQASNWIRVNPSVQAG